MRQRRGLLRSCRRIAFTAPLVLGLAVGVTAYAASSSSDPVVTGALTAPVSTASLQSTLNEVFGPGFDKSKLNTWEQAAFKVAAQPLTKAQLAFVNDCIKNTTCQRSTGKWTIGYADGFGLNGWRKQNRVGFAAALARYPGVKKFVYTDGKGDLTTMISNIRSLIAQKVNVIIGSFDAGDAELPAIQEAARAGIPVIAYTQGAPSAKYQGQDLTFSVRGNECSTGTQWGAAAVKAVHDPTVVIFTGSPGNPYGALWEPCAAAAIKAGGGTVVTYGTTNWAPQGEAQAAAALLAKGLPDVVLYDYTQQYFMATFAGSGKFPKVLDGGTQDMGSYAEWLKVSKQYKFKLFANTTQNGFQPVAVYLAVAKLLHKVPAGVQGNVPLPITVFPMAKLAPWYVPAAGGGAAFGSALPKSLIIAAQSAS